MARLNYQNSLLAIDASIPAADKSLLADTLTNASRALSPYYSMWQQTQAGVAQDSLETALKTSDVQTVQDYNNIVSTSKKALPLVDRSNPYITNVFNRYQAGSENYVKRKQSQERAVRTGYAGSLLEHAIETGAITNEVEFTNQLNNSGLSKEDLSSPEWAVSERSLRAKTNLSPLRSRLQTQSLVNDERARSANTRLSSHLSLKYQNTRITTDDLVGARNFAFGDLSDDEKRRPDVSVWYDESLLQSRVDLHNFNYNANVLNHMNEHKDKRGVVASDISNSNPASREEALELSRQSVSKHYTTDMQKALGPENMDNLAKEIAVNVMSGKESAFGQEQAALSLGNLNLEDLEFYRQAKSDPTISSLVKQLTSITGDAIKNQPKDVEKAYSKLVKAVRKNIKKENVVRGKDVTRHVKTSVDDFVTSILAADEVGKEWRTIRPSSSETEPSTVGPTNIHANLSVMHIMSGLVNSSEKDLAAEPFTTVDNAIKQADNKIAILDSLHTKGLTAKVLRQGRPTTTKISPRSSELKSYDKEQFTNEIKTPAAATFLETTIQKLRTSTEVYDFLNKAGSRLSDDGRRRATQRITQLERQERVGASSYQESSDKASATGSTLGANQLSLFNENQNLSITLGSSIGIDNMSSSELQNSRRQNNTPEWQSTIDAELKSRQNYSTNRVSAAASTRRSSSFVRALDVTAPLGPQLADAVHGANDIRESYHGDRSIPILDGNETAAVRELFGAMSQPARDALVGSLLAETRSGRGHVTPSDLSNIFGEVDVSAPQNNSFMKNKTFFNNRNPAEMITDVTRVATIAGLQTITKGQQHQMQRDSAFAAGVSPYITSTGKDEGAKAYRSATATLNNNFSIVSFRDNHLSVPKGRSREAYSSLNNQVNSRKFYFIDRDGPVDISVLKDPLLSWTRLLPAANAPITGSTAAAGRLGSTFSVAVPFTDIELSITSRDVLEALSPSKRINQQVIVFDQTSLGSVDVYVVDPSTGQRTRALDETGNPASINFLDRR